MALVELRSISKSYPRRKGMRSEEHFVVTDVSLSMERGETLGLVGESGSGKSTIARILLGLVPPTSGTVSFAGVELTTASKKEMQRLRRRLQPVFQDPFAALNPRMRIADIIAEPLLIHRRDSQIDASREGLRRQTRELLRAVGMDDSALLRYPHEFSGGQRQRINIARALALRPELLVLDEPVSALDVSVGAQIVNLLRELQRDFSLTYLFISHSMPLVHYLADRIAVMRGGRIVETGNSEDVCLRPRDPYTQALIAATPEIVPA
ncbi:MAG TPA: ATP-binding cassette domain-containing protein [Acidisarcina sp.]|nr:ATP-binding cassette domain-containing protein [Acidisarcina sp.]